MKIIIPFGKPGAGKGTLIGKIMKGRENWSIISTGAALRQAVNDETELGKQAKVYIEQGKLVPDKVGVGIVRDALDAVDSERVEGVILDGFPRTVSQAKTMIGLGIIPTKVLILDVSDETVIYRISRRVECEACKTSFSLEKGPYHLKKDGICDKCGARLIRRKDDEPEIVKARLEEYTAKTAPILQYLEELQVPMQNTSCDVSEEEIERLLS